MPGFSGTCVGGRSVGRLLVLLGVVWLAGCQTAYYSTMEKFGIEKRDILVDRVEEASETQEEVKEQFREAYQAFDALLKLPTSELQVQYETLSEAYEESEEKAEELRGRVAAIETVAEDLFDEWERELDEYSSANLRRESARKLKETRARYGNYIRALKQATRKVDPVLAVFKDQVLFLKHNLNAEKVSALKGEVRNVNRDVESLIQEMDRSINEARQFLKGIS